MRRYAPSVKIIRQGNKKYVQVVQNIRKDDGSMTTKVIRSFGIATEENIRRAEELVADLTAYLREENAPMLEINPASLRSLEMGPLFGIISPEITPRVWYGLYKAAYIFIKENIKTDEGLRRMIELLQPDLKTNEDRERFYRWIKNKPTEEKIRILIKRWYYPKRKQGDKSD